MTTAAGPTGYPQSWRPKGSPAPDPPDLPPASFSAEEAVALAIDAYVGALTEEQFTALVTRTRNGGAHPSQQPGQYQQQPSTYGR